MAQAFAFAVSESKMSDGQFADALCASPLLKPFREVVSHDQVRRYRTNLTRLPAFVLLAAAGVVERPVDELVHLAANAPEARSQAERLNVLEAEHRELRTGYEHLAELLRKRGG